MIGMVISQSNIQTIEMMLKQTTETSGKPMMAAPKPTIIAVKAIPICTYSNDILSMSIVLGFILGNQYVDDYHGNHIGNQHEDLDERDEYGPTHLRG